MNYKRLFFLLFSLSIIISSPLKGENTVSPNGAATETLKKAGSIGTKIAYFCAAGALAILIHEIGHGIFLKKYLNNPALTVNLGVPLPGMEKGLFSFNVGKDTLKVHLLPLGGSVHPSQNIKDTLTTSQKVIMLGAGPLIGALSQAIAIAGFDLLKVIKEPKTFSQTLKTLSFSCLKDLPEDALLSNLRNIHRTFLFANLANLFPINSGMDGAKIGKALGCNEVIFNTLGTLLYPFFAMSFFAQRFRPPLFKNNKLDISALTKRYLSILARTIVVDRAVSSLNSV